MKLGVGIVTVLGALVANAHAHASPERRTWTTFDYKAHLGNLSPYQKGPVPSGIRETLPEDCKVEQVMLVRCASVF